MGITDFAQAALGDIVFVDLPDVGDEFEAKDSFGSVESVKAASDVYAPVSGTIVEVNEALTDEPGLVNSNAGMGNPLCVQRNFPDLTFDNYLRLKRMMRGLSSLRFRMRARPEIFLMVISTRNYVKRNRLRDRLIV